MVLKLGSNVLPDTVLKLHGLYGFWYGFILFFVIVLHVVICFFCLNRYMNIRIGLWNPKDYVLKMFLLLDTMIQPVLPVLDLGCVCHLGNW